MYLSNKKLKRMSDEEDSLDNFKYESKEKKGR